MRKRLTNRVWGPALALLLFALLFASLRKHPDLDAPKFISGSKPNLQAGDDFSHYPFLEPIPFSEGITWIDTMSKTNGARTWLLNVGTGEILGELTNAEPLAIDGKRKRLLCRTLQQPMHPFLKKARALLAQITRRQIPLNTDESYWLVDFTGKAMLVGKIAPPMFHSTLMPSPDLDRAYLVNSQTVAAVRSHGRSSSELFLFNLTESNSIVRCRVPGWPCGWWSAQEILCKPDYTTGNFSIYNVNTKAISTIISAEQFADWARDHDIKADLSRVGAFQVWDGTNFDFFVTDLHSKWEATNSFLAQITREEPRLVLMAADFHFQWSDHLHPNRQSYVYTGRDAGNNSSAVFVRRVRGGEDRMIVPPDGPYFSIPRFYGDSVVFVRSNMLWRTDLQGSNTVRLFPTTR